jgi:hypothetical protein
VLRDLLHLAADDPLPGPWFEGFAIDVSPPRGADPYHVLDAALRAVLGTGWEQGWLALAPSEPLGPARAVLYEVVPREHQRVAAAQAWEHAYALREQRGIADVEPEFVLFRSDAEAIEDLPPGRRWALFGEGHLPQTETHCEWCLDQMRVKPAWERTRGEGIAIGHPDTGYLPHPELGPLDGSGAVDAARGRDFVADDDDARAELDEDGPLPGGPNHGTSTASVIVSARGQVGAAGPGAFVSGVAPGVRLVPLRVSNSVVHFSMRRVRKAIEYAVREQLPIVSLSLGGPFPSRHLEEVIGLATSQGMIVIAAAGNNVPFRPVVWPARYPDVVAVAACNADARPWSGSSRGEPVDITAPGESVWRAFVDVEASSSASRYRVERSSGTSYATAHIAGVCALWLAHHGASALVSRYRERLSDAFRYVLAQTARPSPELPAQDFGPGIVDAQALLAFALPTKDRVASWADGPTGSRGRLAAAAPRGAKEGILADFHALFPTLDPAQIRAALESLLGASGAALERKLREVGDELLFQLAVDPTESRRFVSLAEDLGRQPTLRSAAARQWGADLYAPIQRNLRRRASPRLSSQLG